MKQSLYKQYLVKRLTDQNWLEISATDKLDAARAFAYERLGYLDSSSPFLESVDLYVKNAVTREQFTIRITAEISVKYNTAEVEYE